MLRCGGDSNMRGNYTHSIGGRCGGLWTGGTEKIRCSWTRACACVRAWLLVTRPRVRAAWRFLVRRSVCFRGGRRTHNIPCTLHVRVRACVSMRVRVWVQECKCVACARAARVRCTTTTTHRLKRSYVVVYSYVRLFKRQ